MIDFYCNRQITISFLRTHVDFKARSSVQVTQYITHTTKCVKTLIRECFKKSHYLIATVRFFRTLQITSNRISSSPAVLDLGTNRKIIFLLARRSDFSFFELTSIFSANRKNQMCKICISATNKKRKTKTKTKKKKKEKNQKKK